MTNSLPAVSGGAILADVIRANRYRFAENSYRVRSARRPQAGASKGEVRWST
jgi:hypothetical protein